MKVDVWISRLIVPRRPPTTGPEAATSLVGAGLERGTVDGEVLLGQQAPRIRLAHHPCREGIRDRGHQESVPAFGNSGRIPHRLIGAQAYKPPKQQVVVELLRQPPLAANGLQQLQQQRSRQPQGRDRGPTGRPVQGGGAGRELDQNPIEQRPDGAVRMIGGDLLFDIDESEQNYPSEFWAPHSPDSTLGLYYSGRFSCLTPCLTDSISAAC
jgi:hypothetical protein